MGHISNGNIKRACCTLQGWYRKLENKSPKPCCLSLEKQTLKREQLCAHVPPPGDPMPSHIEQPPMDDTCPLDHEVQRVVKKESNR